MKDNKKSGLIVFIIILVIIVLFALFGQFVPINKKNQNKSFKSTIVNAKNAKNGYIAELHIEGVIQKANADYNQEWLMNTISDLKCDKNNKAIAIFINSPGGTVYEADEVYLALQDYKTTGRPIYCYQAGLAASGGYYISCAANKIYANRNTLTGSIGVLTGNSIDMTGLLDKIGIKSKTFHAGRNKNMLNYNEPLTKEQQEIMQSLADDCYEQFIGIVATGRNLSLAQVRKIADGRIYSANQALSNGLIDAIDSWSNMIENLKSEKFDGKNLNVVKYEYCRNPTLKEMILEGFTGFSQLQALDKQLCAITIQKPALLYTE